MVFQADSEIRVVTAVPAMRYYKNAMKIIQNLALPTSSNELVSRPIRVLFTTSSELAEDKLHADCFNGTFLTVKSGLAPPVELHIADQGRYFEPLWNDAGTSGTEPPPLERQNRLEEVEKDDICYNYDVVVIYIQNQPIKEEPELLESVTKSLTQKHVFIAMTEIPQEAETHSRLRHLQNLFYRLGGFLFNPLKSMKSKWWLFCKHEGIHLVDIISWACKQYLLLEKNAYAYGFL
ncbi:hypothetical protein Aperf_G00000124238 [Anoplocephala perfoliata]